MLKLGDLVSTVAPSTKIYIFIPQKQKKIYYGKALSLYPHLLNESLDGLIVGYFTAGFGSLHIYLKVLHK